MTLELGTKLMAGLAKVAMATVEVLAHVPLEAVSVYTTLAEGVIIILCPVTPPGFHVYVAAPPPVNCKVLLAQTTVFVVMTLKPGKLFTVKANVFVSTQFAFDLITVYVVLTVGLTVIELLFELPGNHV